MTATVGVRVLLRELASKLDGENRVVALRAAGMLTAALKDRSHRPRGMAEEGRPAR